jgi:hypothetical protein
MKHLFTNRSLPLLVSVTLATVTLPALLAESHCPAGIASVTSRFVQRALIVIPVRINQKGPFDFMVDTGSQAFSGTGLFGDGLALQCPNFSHLPGVTGLPRITSSFGFPLYLLSNNFSKSQINWSRPDLGDSLDVVELSE